MTYRFYHDHNCKCCGNERDYYQPYTGEKECLKCNTRYKWNVNHFKWEQILKPIEIEDKTKECGPQILKGIHEIIAQKIGAKVDEKSAAYNAGGRDAVAKIEDILKIHYPNGVKPKQYRDLCLIVRIEDKICRIASGNKKAFDESPYEDIVGYGLRGSMLDMEESANENDK